jgi:hypothetical protein
MELNRPAQPRRSIRFWTDLTPKAFLKQNPTTTHHSPTTPIDLEASLNDAEASPVVALVDRILLQGDVGERQ